MGSPNHFDALLRLLGVDPAWRPAIGHVLALDETVETQTLMEDRAHNGKVVLDIDRSVTM